MKGLTVEIGRKAKESDFSGAISIRRGRSVVYRVAFGSRVVNENLPNEISTRFGIASGTKLITALGIGRLIDDRKLSLQTSVGELGSDFHGFIDEHATIHHLLSHTSGIYDYYDEELVDDFERFSVEIPWSKLETPSDYLPLFRKGRAKFHRGQRYSYSNGGYVLLGVIIERVSGRLYREFVETDVLRPAGMTDSGFYAFHQLPPNTALGYLNDRISSNIYSLPLRGGGDGGMYTTADDVHSLWEKLFSNSILSRDLTARFLETHQAFDAIDGYGLGIYKKLDAGEYSIIGSDVGVGFYSIYLVSTDTSAVILSNRTDGHRHMANLIVSRLRDGS